jgi:hypothetical protein
MNERRVADLVARLDVGVVVEQQRSDIDVAFFNGTMQCSVAVVVGSVDVGAVRNQSLDVAEFAVNAATMSGVLPSSSRLLTFGSRRMTLILFDFCCLLLTMKMKTMTVALR